MGRRGVGDEKNLPSRSCSARSLISTMSKLCLPPSYDKSGVHLFEVKTYSTVIFGMHTKVTGKSLHVTRSTCIAVGIYSTKI